MDYLIRNTEITDAEELLEYYKIMGGQSNNNSFGSEGLYTDVEKLKEDIKEVSQAKCGLWLLVIVDGNIIGMGKLEPRPRRFSHRSTFAINVLEKYWHRGIGTALSEKLICHAKECGTEIVELLVNVDNVYARRIYNKLGFKGLGTIPALCKNGNEYYDFEMMYLDLR